MGKASLMLLALCCRLHGWQLQLSYTLLALQTHAATARVICIKIMARLLVSAGPANAAATHGCLTSAKSGFCCTGGLGLKVGHRACARNGAIVTWPSVVLVLLFRLLLLHLVRRCQAPPLHEKALSRCSQKSVLLVALFDIHV